MVIRRSFKRILGHGQLKTRCSTGQSSWSSGRSELVAGLLVVDELESDRLPGHPCEGFLRTGTIEVFRKSTSHKAPKLCLTLTLRQAPT